MRYRSLTSCLLLCAAGCTPNTTNDTAMTGTDANPLGPRPANAPQLDPALELPGLPPSLEFTARVDGLPEQGMWKCDPVFADLNADGHLDLAAIPRLGNGPRVWFGDGNGTWTDASNGLRTERPSCGGGLAAVDLNGDGHLDLAVADHCSGGYVYLGDGAGQWTVVAAGLHPDVAKPGSSRSLMLLGAEDLDVGDVNGDGFHDLVIGASDEGGINVYFGDGTGRNWNRDRVGVELSGWANRVQLHDMNGDGHLDVVASHCEGPRVWHGDGTGSWRKASQDLPAPIIRGMYTGIAVADVNNDGLLDIAAANWVNGPEVFIQTHDHTWRQMNDVFPQMTGGSVGVALGDLDRDGNADLLVSGRLRPTGGLVRGVFALLGDGAGGWTVQESCGLPATGMFPTTGITLGDIDHDGYLDIATGSGLIVESGAADAPKTPALDARLIVWSTGPAGREADANRIAEVDLASQD